MVLLPDKDSNLDYLLQRQASYLIRRSGIARAWRGVMSAGRPGGATTRARFESGEPVTAATPDACWRGAAAAVQLIAASAAVTGIL